MTTIREQTIAAVRKENTPFVYVDSCLIRSNDNDEQYEGCTCSTTDSCTNCSCTSRFGNSYDEKQCLIMNKTNPIFECNSECQCSLELCRNRCSQKDDQSDNVQLISASNKGYGIIVKQAIVQPGTYIGEYVGEVLSESEAHQRILSTQNSEHNYLLLYNEHHAQSIVKTFIDARYYGNWTRLINHSCDPNLYIVPIRIDQPSPPHLAFFTLRTIQPNEELSYSYGTVIDKPRSKLCYCSSATCTGFMPYQQKD